MATEAEKKEEQPTPEDKSSEKQPGLGEDKAEDATDATKTTVAEGPKDGEEKQGGEKVKDDEEVPQTFPQRVSGT